MIVSMTVFEFIAMLFLCENYNTIPIWLRISIMTIWVISHCVAYGSEDKLREKVKSLEYEVKNLKEGGK